jgi:very-short-patch-repair endonuclease
VPLKVTARQLRRNQTKEEKQLWHALRGRQFAGFKFRRQHVATGHILDFYCADAKLAIELDGFQHGSPEKIQDDEARAKRLAEQGIEVVRFWNHQWRKNRDGCLLDIWNAVQRRTGVVHIMDNVEDQKFIPPDLKYVEIKKRIDPSP